MLSSSRSPAISPVFRCFKPFVALAGLLAVAGCAETQLAGAVVKEVSRSETPSGAGGIWKVGNPYQIAGVWYYPKDDEKYDSTGIASWYGPQFHKRKTANGEVFDMYQVSAAHPTLPMPVMVKVTNLENGRSLIVRVNDRGPFAHGREIDLSMRAAELLGYKEQGTAKVRVQYLARAEDWNGGTGIMTADAQEKEPVKVPVKPVTVASNDPTAGLPPSATMQPVEDENDDDGLGAAPIATAALAPVTGAPIDLTMLAGTTAASAAAGKAVSSGAAAASSAASVAQPASAQPSDFQAAAIPPSDIYVQAGSFRSAANAEALARELGDLGNVQVTDTMVDGTQYYRVRLGPVDGVTNADSLLESVIARGQRGARIVIN